MKFNQTFSFLLISMLIFFVACDEDEKQKVVKKYGNYQTEEENREVVINLSSFKRFDELLERIQDVVCNDSIPQILIVNDSVHKTIQLRSFCYKKYACVLIKQRDVIEVRNDSVFKQDEYYPKDSLIVLMKRDYSNNRKDSYYADHPTKVLIQVSYDNDFGRLEETLDFITNTYDEIQPKVSLKIHLAQAIRVLPPPPFIESEEN